jgi:hypothetical protein
MEGKLFQVKKAHLPRGETLVYSGKVAWSGVPTKEFFTKKTLTLV